LLPDNAQGFNAAHPGHIDIQEYGIKLLLFQFFNSSLSILCNIDIEARCLQLELHGETETFLVIDH
jgi:hypothetical protein